MRNISNCAICVATALVWQIASGAAPAEAADLGGGPADRITEEPQPPARAWSLDFSVNGWLPWMKGNAVVAGRAVELDVAPTDVLGSLDWSKIPVWMSTAELRNGRFAIFNDIVYAALSDSAGYEGRFVAARLNADVELAIVELGASYAIWQGAHSASGATSAIDTWPAAGTGIRAWGSTWQSIMAILPGQAPSIGLIHS